MPTQFAVAFVFLTIFCCTVAIADPPPIPLSAVEVGRDGSRIKFFVERDTTFIDITSPFGIDKATIRRKSPNWPKSIRVRLHLKGLERFSVGNGKVSVDWSVGSTGEHTSNVCLRSGDKETVLDAASPYHTTVRIVGDNETLPLRNGYFDVPLPDKLFAQNPAQITLRWIDFYRN